MSSCLMPTQPVSPITSAPCRLPKRSRSPTEEAMSIERIVKAHKRTSQDSPCALTTEPALPTDDAIFTPIVFDAEIPVCKAPWPVIASDANVKYALAFLQDSRMHALALLAQGQWPRALGVLEKVERANDMISRQRRRAVLEQSNAATCTMTSADQTLPQTQTQTDRVRKIRFSDDVNVAAAADVDRAPAKMPPLVREEILLLRASRSIPTDNYSEFWN